MNTEPTIEELKALIDDLKRQLALALDAAVGRSKHESHAAGSTAFAAIRRTKYPHEYAGWNVEHDSPKWTSDRLDAAPVPLQTLVSELNKVAAREANVWAVVYLQDTPSRP